MKTILLLFFSVIIVLSLRWPERCVAQSVAIGHVTAEVIESVSASSQAVTRLSLKPAPFANSTQESGEPVVISPMLNLGSMTVNPGGSATVDVVLKPASLSNPHGNGFTLDTSLTKSTVATAGNSNGSQNIKLNGIANLDAGQASGEYQGSYTVIFAYN